MKEKWTGWVGVWRAGEGGIEKRRFSPGALAVPRRVKRVHGWVRTSLPSQDKLVRRTEQHAGDARVLI